MLKNKKSIPAEWIQKVKDKINLVDVVSEHVVLRKVGANYQGLCPFHAERTPSFSVHEVKQLYHCYGCKAGGDLVTFIQEIHGLSFIEALRELSERADIPIPDGALGGDGKEDPGQKKRREERQMAYRLNHFAARFYQNNLSTSTEAKDYLLKRGISVQNNNPFLIGYANPEWDTLSNYLNEKKAPMRLALDIGLIRPSSKNYVPRNDSADKPGYFDLFRDRIMFPIIDLRGKIVAFGGRMLPMKDNNAAKEGLPINEGGTTCLPAGQAKADTGGLSPKYLNSPDSLVFQKSRQLFGLFQASKHIREKKEVIVVEGFFDAIALSEAGFMNVVATCGTALTEEHLKQIGRLKAKILLLFDTDKAGLEARDRAMELGLANDTMLYDISLPKSAKDPSEFLFGNDGKLDTAAQKTISDLVENSIPLLDDRIEDGVQKYLDTKEDSETRVHIIRKLAYWLSLLNDSVGRSMRKQMIQDKLRLDPFILNAALNEALVEKNKSRQNFKTSGASDRNKNKPEPVNQNVNSSVLKSGSMNPNFIKGTPTGRSICRGSIKGGLPGRRLTFHRAEEVLLRCMINSEKFTDFWPELGAKLPPSGRLSELFISQPLREWVNDVIVESGENFLIGGVNLDKYQSQTASIPSEIRKVLTASWVDVQGGPEVGELKQAINFLLERFWARFSHKIKAEINQAEVKKDLELQRHLMKEYLDAQKKIKELSIAYEE